jgi:peptidoglycan hydrolase CwlO-like protein
MAKNITTIEALAKMINEGFKSTATKEDVEALDQKIQALDTKVTEGFERIETLLIAERKREIEDLKKRMKRLEDVLAV